MPVPILFIGIAAVTGAAGIGSSAKAAIDAKNAGLINKNAEQILQESTDIVNAQRLACGDMLAELGREKISVLDGSMQRFLQAFGTIKNIDFRSSEGLDELARISLDQHEFEELRAMANLAGKMAGAAVAGGAGGALVAFGAYGAAQSLACASTGTAIASLSGAAATNATLAFFGGGSLAAGGLGVAGGTAVLGGLVGGPALLVAGIIMSHAAHKNLEQARTNKAEALQVAAELDAASLQCAVIRRRAIMFYSLLARLDARFLPLVVQTEDIIADEGDDYQRYSDRSKAAIASCASVAAAIKTVLDTKILTDDGVLTDESEENGAYVENFLSDLRVA